MAEKKKILIIDDEPNIVTFMTVLMEDNGYLPISASNGVEGLEKAKAEKPDLILLDISMPEKTGVKFYRNVREDDELKHIPVVMVTGIMKQFEQFISKRRQVPPPDGYFSKPVDQKELLKTIAELLASSN